MTSTPSNGRPQITPALVSALARGTSAHAALVWVYLWSRADIKSARAWPTTKTIAADLGSCRNRVMRSVATLEHAGWVQILRAPGTRNQYVITAPCGVACEIGHPQEAGVRNGTGVVCEIGHPPACEIGPSSEHYQLNTTKNTTSPRPKLRFDEADEATARWMFGKIQALGGDPKEPSYPKWANDIRLMREQGKRTHEQIRAIFNWANQDGFWSSNILSPDKLRKKWQQLTLKMKAETNGRKGRTHVGAGSVFAPGAEQADSTIGKW